MRWFRFLILAGMLAAAMLALWPVVRSHIPAYLAGFWRNQILAARDDEMPRFLWELTNLGDDGVRVLVGLVGCEQAAVSRNARTLLSAQTDRWLNEEPVQAGRHLAVLAKALASEIDQFGPAGREYAEDLVQRIVAASAEGNPLLPASALPDCERVLEVVAADHRLKWARRVAAGDDAETGLPPVVEIAENPNDGDGAPSHDNPNRHPEETAVTLRPAAEANATAPVRVTPADSDTGPLVPDLLDVDPDGMRELPAMPSARAKTPFRPTRLEQPVEVQASAEHGPQQRADEESRISAWMHQLHDSEARVVHHAETHLTAAGFGPAQLELARRLTSPDAMVREQLAEILPRMPGIDAKTWLVWLSRDPRAEVRMAAITQMATINDPLLLKRIEEMARHDPDRRIQQQGERLVAPQRHLRQH